MISLGRAIDGHSIAAEIKMERQFHKGSFLLLEGEHDERRLGQFVDEQACSIVICFGKPNVTCAIELLYDDGFPGAVGVVDSDFDQILGVVLIHEGLVYSHYHDFELEVLTSESLERYMREVADSKKFEKFASASDYLDSILKSLKPLSALKLANERDNMRYRLKDLRVDEFYDGERIDLDRLVGAASTGRFSDASSKARLREVLDRFIGLNLDLYQCTSGHDVCAAIGISLRDKIGSRAIAQTWRSEVELHIRLTYNRSDFEQSAIYFGLRKWESGNPPYRILN